MPEECASTPPIRNRRIAFLEHRGFLILFLLIGATVMGLTLVYPSLWWLEWIALVPAMLAVYRIIEIPNSRKRIDYRYGLVFFWMHGIVVFHWFLSMYPLSFAELSEGVALVVVLLGVFGFSLLQALIGAFSFVLFGALARGKFLSAHPVLKPFVFSAIWTVFEWIQNFGWWGVPWGRLSLGQIDCLPIVSSISLFGSYWLTFLLVSTSALFGYAIYYVNHKRLASALAAGLFLSNLLLGTIVLRQEKAPQKAITVAAIQGNIENKWDLSLNETKSVYMRLTLEAAEDGAELILWPETALPIYLNESPKTVQWVQNLARSTKATIVVGTYRSELTEDALLEYNSLFAFLPDGTIAESIYDKQKIVPFGEYVPMRDFITTIFPPLGEINILASDLSHGKSGVTLSTPQAEIGGLICFDSIYEDVAHASVQNGAEFFCLASNDLWFMDSAAIYMHYAQARLRAIETGRDVLRAGNSGITALIRYNGEVVEELPPLTEGYIVGEVALYHHRTLYSVIGNAFVYLLLTALLLLGAGETYLRLKTKHKAADSSDEPPACEYLLVLGAKIKNGEPGRALRYRLDAAVERAKASSVPSYFIVSGAKGEATAMRKYLLLCGIPEEHIISEPHATTTEENLLYARKLLPEGRRAIVVTSNFHLFRTKIIARRIEFPIGGTVSAKTPLEILPKAVLREIGALFVELFKKRQ